MEQMPYEIYFLNVKVWVQQMILFFSSQIVQNLETKSSKVAQSLSERLNYVLHGEQTDGINEDHRSSLLPPWEEPMFQSAVLDNMNPSHCSKIRALVKLNSDHFRKTFVVGRVLVLVQLQEPQSTGF